MDKQFYQETVENIFALLGVKLSGNRLSPSLRGAYVYVGGHKPVINTTPNKGSKSVWTPEGFLSMGVGIQFQPNFGKVKIKYIITLDESRDLYDLIIVKVRGADIKLINHIEGLYFDQVAEVVESQYNQYIKEHFQGFIPC